MHGELHHSSPAGACECRFFSALPRHRHALVPCHAGTGICKSQESSLALLWTLGIFTLNCGPVLMGFVLDSLGPKLTGILGGWVGGRCPADGVLRGQQRGACAG